MKMKKWTMNKSGRQDDKTKSHTISGERRNKQEQ